MNKQTVVCFYKCITDFGNISRPGSTNTPTTHFNGSSIQFSCGGAPDKMNSQPSKPVQWNTDSDSYRQARVINYS